MASEKPSVLIVDDDRLNRRLLSELLNGEEFAVATADSGEMAVARCLEQPFDVVLMDVNLPGINGVEATAKIKKGMSPPKIIGLTAHASQKDRVEFLDAGMDDCLPKPIDLPQLVSLVRQYGELKRPGIADASRDNVEYQNETTPSNNLAVLDVNDAMKRLGSNRRLFNRFIEIFREDVPGLLASAGTALAEGDFNGLADAAHRLRGISANLSAHALSDSARQLEDFSGRREIEKCRTQLEAVWLDIQRLEHEFEQVD